MYSVSCLVVCPSIPVYLMLVDTSQRSYSSLSEYFPSRLCDAWCDMYMATVTDHGNKHEQHKIPVSIAHHFACATSTIEPLTTFQNPEIALCVFSHSSVASFNYLKTQLLQKFRSTETKEINNSTKQPSLILVGVDAETTRAYAYSDRVKQASFLCSLCPWMAEDCALIVFDYLPGEYGSASIWELEGKSEEERKSRKSNMRWLASWDQAFPISAGDTSTKDQNVSAAAIEALREELGVPYISCSLRTGRGLKLLRDETRELAQLIVSNKLKGHEGKCVVA